MCLNRNLWSGRSIGLDEHVRKGAPGEFAALSDGWCHYQLTGPSGGPVVVLVHGFSVPSFIWDGNNQPLIDAGFRTLRYDLFGRGFSDRPSSAHAHELFVGQLEELLNIVGISDPVSLVGLSMGGAVSAAFALRYPDAVSKLALISPAGVMKESPAMHLIRLPLVGELLFQLGGESMLMRGLNRNAYPLREYEHYVQKFRRQLALPGYRRALLSTLRGDLLCHMLDTYQELGRRRLRSLLIWGRDDHLTAFEQSRQIRAAMPGIEFHPLIGAGHLANIEKQESVNSILIRFLRQ